MVTDLPSTLETKSLMRIVGYDMTASAARRVYEQSGVGPEDLDVVELHACFTMANLRAPGALPCNIYTASADPDSLAAKIATHTARCPLCGASLSRA